MPDKVTLELDIQNDQRRLRLAVRGLPSAQRKLVVAIAEGKPGNPFDLLLEAAEGAVTALTYAMTDTKEREGSTLQSNHRSIVRFDDVVTALRTAINAAKGNQ